MCFYFVTVVSFPQLLSFLFWMLSLLFVVKAAAPLAFFVCDGGVRVVVPPMARSACCGAQACFSSGVVQWGFGFAAILDSGCDCGGRGVNGGVLLVPIGVFLCCLQQAWCCLQSNDAAVHVGCQYLSPKHRDFSPLRRRFCDVSFGLIPCVWLLLGFGTAVYCCFRLLN
jgi:hypothetical protein